jgi:hypothetical protein
MKEYGAEPELFGKGGRGWAHRDRGTEGRKGGMEGETRCAWFKIAG